MENLEMIWLFVGVWRSQKAWQGCDWACHKSCWSERLTALGEPLVLNTQLPSDFHRCYLLWEHKKRFGEQHSQPLSWEFGCGSKGNILTCAILQALYSVHQGYWWRPLSGCKLQFGNACPTASIDCVISSPLTSAFSAVPGEICSHDLRLHQLK